MRLGLPGTIGQVVSVPLILAVRERYPKVKLCVAEAMSGFVLEWVKEGRVDGLMVYLGVDDRKLRSSPILTEELRRSVSWATPASVRRALSRATRTLPAYPSCSRAPATDCASSWRPRWRRMACRSAPSSRSTPIIPFVNSSRPAWVRDPVEHCDHGTGLRDVSRTRRSINVTPVADRPPGATE